MPPSIELTNVQEAELTRLPHSKLTTNKESAIRAALKLNDLAHARRLVNGGHHGLPAFREAFAAGRHDLGIVIPLKARAKIKPKAKAKSVIHASATPTGRPAAVPLRRP